MGIASFITDKRTSRIVTGFHRLGIVLALPFVLAAIAFCGFAFVSSNGPYVPDPTAKPKETVLLIGSYAGPNSVLLKQSFPFKTDIEFDTGPIRKFSIFFKQDMSGTSAKSDEGIGLVLRSVIDFEKQRGAVLRPNELPAQIGAVGFIEEPPNGRQNEYLKWTHLKRGIDRDQFLYALISLALGIIVFAMARAFGWIMDGFFKP